MNYKVMKQVELASSTLAPHEQQMEILLVQGGIAVAVNLSLAFVLLALAKLVAACRKAA